MSESQERSRSVFALIGQLPGLLIRTVRGEIALVKADVAARVAAVGIGVALFAVAGFIGLIALVLLIVSGIVALAQVVPLWLSLLLIAAGLLLIAGLFGLLGAASLASLKKPIRRGASDEAKEAARRTLRKRRRAQAPAAPPEEAR